MLWWVLTDASSLALFSLSYECYNYALGTLELDISSYCDAHHGQSLTETSILSIPPFLSLQPEPGLNLWSLASSWCLNTGPVSLPLSPSKVLSLISRARSFLTWEEMFAKCLQICSINHLTIANHTPINRKKMISAHSQPCPALLCSATIVENCRGIIFQTCQFRWLKW